MVFWLGETVLRREGLWLNQKRVHRVSVRRQQADHVYQIWAMDSSSMDYRWSAAGVSDVIDKHSLLCFTVRGDRRAQ